MVEPARDYLVFEGLHDVAAKVRRLLADEGVDAAVLALPFVSPQVVEGQVANAIRMAQLWVSLAERAASLAIIERNRSRIDVWSGSV